MERRGKSPMQKNSRKLYVDTPLKRRELVLGWCKSIAEFDCEF